MTARLTFGSVDRRFKACDFRHVLPARVSHRRPSAKTGGGALLDFLCACPTMFVFFTAFLKSLPIPPPSRMLAAATGPPSPSFPGTYSPPFVRQPCGACFSCLATAVGDLLFPRRLPFSSPCLCLITPCGGNLGTFPAFTICVFAPGSKAKS